MSESNYPSKICRPLLANVLFRERLFAKLDTLRRQDIVWVSGPGGAGKTTLINSYAAAKDLPCLWYQVDSSDQDLATFFSYLALAGKKATRKPQGEYPALTAEYRLGIHEFSRNFFAKLFQHLQPDSLLVFDNCQDVGENAELYNALLAGLTRMPRGMNIVFISRNESVATLSRLKANREMSFLNWTDLRLTFEEVTQIVTEQNSAYSQEQLIKLHKLIDGWAAGLTLMAAPNGYNPRTRSPTNQLQGQSQQNIFEYFAEEVFAQLDICSCEFLIRSSLLPYLDKGLVEIIGDSRQALALLNELHRANMYITQLASSPPVYQYHQLFKEFLRERCRTMLSGEEIVTLQSAAGQQLIANNQTLEAAQLLIEAEDWSSLHLLISTQAPALYQKGQFQTLADWLQHIPEPVVNTAPWLLYWAGMCLMLQDPAAGKTYFEQSLAGFEERQDVAGLYLAASGLGECLGYGFNSFTGYDQWIEQLAELHATYPEFPSREIEARVTISMLNGLSLRKPASNRLPAWRQRAHTLMAADSGISAELKIQLLIPLILNRLFSGNLLKANSLIEVYRSLAEVRGMPTLAVLTLKNFESYYHWQNGNSEECCTAVNEALNLAAESGIHVLSFLLLLNGANGALCAADLALADVYLDDVEPSLGKAGAYVTLIFHLSKTWQYLLAEEPAKALFHAETALHYASDAGNPESTAFAHFGYALALHGAARYDEAASQLKRSQTLGTEAKARQVTFACLVTQAEFALVHGDEVAAGNYLKKGFAIGRENAYTSFYGWRSETMSRLCQLALQQGIERRYTEELIRRRRLLPGNSLLFLQQWPWKLRVSTLGTFKIICDGAPLRSSKKSKQKPLALLKSLIAFGAIGVSQSALEDALWPDADGDMQHQIFNTTLHRLRKLLGSNDFLILHGGELTLNDKLCWLDIWSFDRHVDKIAQGVTDGVLTPQSTKSAERVAELYRGPFLASEPEGWVISLRDKLYNKMVQTIERLGQYYFHDKQWEQAINWYRRGIEIDPHTELFYHQLMRCYHSQDRKAEALRIYKQCHTILKASMGVSPSQAMQKLYREIGGTAT